MEPLPAWLCWPAVPSPEPGRLGYPRSHAAQEQEAQGREGGAIQAALPLCGHSSASGGQGGGASLQLHSLSCSSWRTLVFSATLNRICIFYALAVYLTKYLGVFFIPPPH